MSREGWVSQGDYQAGSIGFGASRAEMLRPLNDSIGLAVYSLRVVGSSVLTDYLLDLGCGDGNEIVICVLTTMHCARGCNVRTSSG